MFLPSNICIADPLELEPGYVPRRALVGVRWDDDKPGWPERSRVTTGDAGAA